MKGTIKIERQDGEKMTDEERKEVAVAVFLAIEEAKEKYGYKDIEKPN